MMLALLTAVAAGPHAREDAAEAADHLVRRVVTQTTRSGFSLSATRELTAGTMSGKHQAWMTVQTTVTQGGVFAWQVLEEGGSERTRKSVFRSLLENEEKTWDAETRHRSALTPENYTFAVLPRTSPQSIRIRLTPRREDSSLIDGILTVTPDGYPLSLEGRLAKSPSFWVKSVTVVKHFRRVGGLALPVSIESLADLRFFGRATLLMRYQYQEVNGRSVPQVADGPVTSPTPEILALHNAQSRE